MTAALTEDWGVGETTAALIADVYGGHVLTAENTLCRLAMEGPAFRLVDGFMGSASPGPFLHHGGSRGFVEELGVNGVVAADMNARRAVFWELGSLVTQNTQLVHFSGQRLLQPWTACVLPTCQFVRMNIMLGLYGVAKIN